MAQRVELHEKKKEKKTWARNKEKKMVGPTPLRDLRKNPDPRMDGP